MAAGSASRRARASWHGLFSGSGHQGGQRLPLPCSLAPWLSSGNMKNSLHPSMNERKIIFTWHPGAPLVSRKMITPAWLPDSPGLPSWFRDPQPVSLPRLHDPGMAPAWPALAPAAEAITRRGHGLPWHRSWRQAAACCILPGILRDHRSDHPAGVAAGSASRRARARLEMAKF